MFALVLGGLGWGREEGDWLVGREAEEGAARSTKPRPIRDEKAGARGPKPKNTSTLEAKFCV